MRLIYRLLIRLSLVMSVIVAAWAFLFYWAIVDETNDEVDDALEDYAEMIMLRSLAGEELPDPDDGLGNRYRLSEVTAAFAEQKDEEEIYYTDEEEHLRYLSMIFRDRDDRYYELLVSTPTIDTEDLQEAAFYWCLFLYITLLVSGVLITLWVFYRSLRPLYVLLDWLDSYRIGAENKPLRNDTSVREFRKLNEAAQRYAERSEAMFEQQKRFIGNASHEIQTPLAISLNRLENLMEDESLTEAQLGEIYETHKTLEYITRLNKALLLLTKIDNRQFLDSAEIELNPLVDRYVDDFKMVYAHRDLSVEVEEAGDVRLRMNESLLASLFSNLIKNAFIHTPEGGRIRIRCAPGSFVIRNTAAGGALDRERLFERFYQVRKKEGSTGLGLAIVRSICEAQGFRIGYDFSEGEHIFSVKFGV